MKARRAIGLIAIYTWGPFFEDILLGIQSVTQRHGIDIIAIQGTVAQVAQRQLARDRVDGWLVLSYAQGLDLLVAQGKPLVTIGTRAPGQRCPAVLANNQQGIAEVMEHLFAQGHTRIAFIGSLSVGDIYERYKAYQAAHTRRGMPLDPTLVINSDSAYLDGGTWAAQQLLASGASFTALVAGNDWAAMGAMQVLQAHGYRIPEDIAIVGFDDIPDAQVTSPTLSTVRQRFDLLSATAADLLLAQLDGRPVDAGAHYIPTTFVPRESSGGRAVPTVSSVSVPADGPNWQGALATRLVGLVAPDHALVAPDVSNRIWPGVDHLVQLLTDTVAGTVNQDVVREVIPAIIDSLMALNPAPGALAQMMLTIARVGLAGRAAEQDATQVRSRISAFCEYVATEIVRSYRRHQHAHSNSIESDMRSMLRISQQLIGASPTHLQWLSETSVDSGCLALWQAEQPDTLAIVGSYQRGTTGMIPTGIQVSAAQFPPPEALVPATSDTTTYTLLTVQSASRDYGILMVSGRFVSHDASVMHQTSQSMGLIHSLLASALERDRLQQSLHHEIHQRQEAEAALQQSHAELEHRVAARTAELAHANALLVEQISERQRAEAHRAKLEAQLHQIQKIEAIGQLAGGIAHDFNNLLMIINGYSDLLLRDLAPDDPLRDSVEPIMAAGERAAALTRQLLAFSRKQVLHPQVLNLNQVVTNVETLLRRLIGEDITLTLRLDPALTPVMADPSQLEQIIFNLAVNARDAMPHGGTLTIATVNITQEQIDVEAAVRLPRAAYVQLQVSDTGIGMDADTQARIFEPFFTTKPQGKGTGLGLATVFGIVQQSGGTITVTSTPQHGTTFTINLPQSTQPEEDRALDQNRSIRAQSGSETILIVEDDNAVRSATRRFLINHGYTVLEAADGLAALLLCRQHSGPIHLVITDVVMPGMSGRELVEHLARIRPELPVLYVSGYTDSTIIRHGLAAGNIALLQKPFTADALAHAVREMLDRPAPASTGAAADPH